jgi:anti-sigma factor RsiW
MSAERPDTARRCTSRFPSLMERLFLEELPARKLRELRRHLASCVSCQQRYNRIVLAGRLLEGGPDALTVPSEGELARVGVAVLERVRMMTDPAPPRRLGLLRWAIALGAAAAIVVAVVVPLALRRAPTGSTHGVEGPTAEFSAEPLQPRGPTTTVAQDVSPVGLRAFCLRKVDSLPQPQITALAPSESGPATCRLDGLLKFAYTNRSTLGFLFLVGVDESYRIQWYEPHPPRQRSVALRRDVVDEPLSRAVRLAVNHTAGTLRIFALFSSSPLPKQEIERAVARARTARTPLSKLAALPLGQVEQHSVMVRLVP